MDTSTFSPAALEADENDTSLQITRIIPASHADIYALWIDVERAREWWGPEGAETIEIICDTHPGGPFVWTLCTPEGEVMTARGLFQDVQPGHKVSYTWQWEADPQWEEVQSLVTVEFRDNGAASTEVRLTHTGFPTKESKDNHVAGWTSALDKLARLVA